MKKVLIGFLVLLMLSVASLAFADETKVSLGLKMWANKWEEKGDPEVGTEQTFDQGSALMAGPALNIRFPNNLFIGVTYLTTLGEYESEHWDSPTAADKMSFDRKDLDLMAGYMATPQFGFFFGYKTIDAPAKYTYPAQGINNVDVGTWKVKGPGIGILGNIPVGESAALYGNFALLFMEQEFVFSAAAGGGGTKPFDTVGAVLEVGVAFAFTDNLSANVGIKAQSFSGKAENGPGTADDVTWTDTFSGLTAGVTYTF